MSELSVIAKISLSIFLLLGIILNVILIIKGKIKIEWGMIWIVAFVIGEVVVLWTQLLQSITRLVGGIYPTAALSVLAFTFIFSALILLTAAVGSLNQKVKDLIQAISILEYNQKERSPSDDGRVEPEKD